MAGRFPLYTDADVNGDLIKALRALGWDIVRGVEEYPERTLDPVHFTRAAELRRVLVSNDEDQVVIAMQWLEEGRPFTGLISWPQESYGTATIGAFARAFEDLAAEDDPFSGFPVHWIKPKP